MLVGIMGGFICYFLGTSDWVYWGWTVCFVVVLGVKVVGLLVEAILRRAYIEVFLWRPLESCPFC